MCSASIYVYIVRILHAVCLNIVYNNVITCIYLHSAQKYPSNPWGSVGATRKKPVSVRTFIPGSRRCRNWSSDTLAIVRCHQQFAGKILGTEKKLAVPVGHMWFSRNHQTVQFTSWWNNLNPTKIVCGCLFRIYIIFDKLGRNAPSCMSSTWLEALLTKVR